MLFLNKIFLVLLTAVVFFFISSSVSFAPTKPAKNLMTDSELSHVEGQTLFNITVITGKGEGDADWTGSQTVIHMDLGIDVEAMGTQHSSKMGFWNNGKWTGWDLDTTNGAYGWAPAGDPNSGSLRLNGIYLDFGFDNIAIDSARTLNFIGFGSKHGTGRLSGTIGTINGFFSNAGTGVNSGVILRGTINFHQVTRFQNDPLGFVFASKYRYDINGYNSNLKGIFQMAPNHNTAIST